ncbi:MAG: hypothetical protein QNK35_16555, partial [Bacteroides sp.]|nr:hypothetical protein [Bacteroides sp.]
FIRRIKRCSELLAEHYENHEEDLRPEIAALGASGHTISLTMQPLFRARTKSGSGLQILAWRKRLTVCFRILISTTKLLGEMWSSSRKMNRLQIRY